MAVSIQPSGHSWGSPFDESVWYSLSTQARYGSSGVAATCFLTVSARSSSNRAKLSAPSLSASRIVESAPLMELARLKAVASLMATAAIPNGAQVVAVSIFDLCDRTSPSGVTKKSQRESSASAFLSRMTSIASPIVVFSDAASTDIFSSTSAVVKVSSRSAAPVTRAAFPASLSKYSVESPILRPAPSACRSTSVDSDFSRSAVCPIGAIFQASTSSMVRGSGVVTAARPLSTAR